MWRDGQRRWLFLCLAGLERSVPMLDRIRLPENKRPLLQWHLQRSILNVMISGMCKGVHVLPVDSAVVKCLSLLVAFD